MGKLHTLRRAILRTPDLWVNRGAFRDSKGYWYPSSMWCYGSYRPYANFVKSVLNRSRSYR